MKIALLASVLVLASCSPADDGAQPQSTAPVPGQPLVVAAVNAPLASFARHIGGDAVEVVLPSLPGDPIYWNPPVEVILEFQAADLIVRNGVGYAGWVDRASLPVSRMVDTTAAHRDALLTIDEQVTHVHGPDGEHTHDATAFTTWLDLALAVEQARAILDALVERRPSHADAMHDRFLALEMRLLALDERLAAAVAEAPDRPLLASHPVYQYLAERYDLDLHSVHWEPGEDPGEDEWHALQGLLLEHPARWMLWEGPPDPASVDRLASLGVQSLVFDPGANPSDGEDFVDLMTRNVAAFETMGE